MRAHANRFGRSRTLSSVIDRRRAPTGKKPLRDSVLKQSHVAAT